jgi:hypothetical protein
MHNVNVHNKPATLLEENWPFSSLMISKNFIS